MSGKSLTRHVYSKRLADGALAYYWQAPPQGRVQGCPGSVALGRDPDEARRKADELNAASDRSGPRREVREGLGIERNGFLSSVER